MDWLAYGLAAEPPEAGVETVMKFLDGNPPTARAQETVGALSLRVHLSDTVLLPVVNERGIVLGLIDRSLDGVESTTPIADLMDPAPTTVRPSVSVESAIKRLKRSNRQAIVVTSSDGQLLGMFRPPIDAVQSRLPEVGVWD